jgi:hypothetical protein
MKQKVHAALLTSAAPAAVMGVVFGRVRPIVRAMGFHVT